MNTKIYLRIARMLVEINYIWMIFSNGIIHAPHKLIGKR